nr:MAG: polyprotein [Qingdao tick iflavirus]
MSLYKRAPSSVPTPLLRFEVFEEDHGIYCFRALLYKWRFNSWSWFDDGKLSSLQPFFYEKLFSWVSRTVQRFLREHVPLDAAKLKSLMRFEGQLLPLMVHVDLENLLKSLRYSGRADLIAPLCREISSDLRAHSRAVQNELSLLGGCFTPLYFNLDRTHMSGLFQQYEIYKTSRAERARQAARAFDDLQERRREAGRVNAFNSLMKQRNREWHLAQQQLGKQRRLDDRLSRWIARDQRWLAEYWRKFDAGLLFEPLSDEERDFVYMRLLAKLHYFKQARTRKVHVKPGFGCPALALFHSTSYVMFRRALRLRRLHFCVCCMNLNRALSGNGKFFCRHCHTQKRISSDFQVLAPKGPSCDWPVAVHQAGEDDLTNTDPVAVSDIKVTSNVKLVDEATTESVVSQPSVTYPSLIDEGRESDIVRELCSRYAYFDSFDWNTTAGPGTDLKVYDFPKDLKAFGFKDSPNFILMHKWYYWHFDLEMRFSLNANKFQVGQLIVGWNYDSTDSKMRMASLQELSQAPHSLVTAPVNDVVELIIPFKYWFPYWANTSALARSFAVVKVKVLNALRVTESVSSRATVLVTVRLRNVRLAGMRSMFSLTVEHQMFSMAVKAVQASLRSVMEDLNRDNPTAPTPHPAMIPYSSHSWSIGTNQVELLNPLRLDPLGVTPHFDSSDEMTVQYITRHFGLVKTFEWEMSHSAQIEIASFVVTPFNICDLRLRHPADTAKFSLPEYESTPLCVVASLFAYWRGSLEFRFDFIATMFHTGRVAFCFIPTLEGNESIEYSKALQSYVTYFDLGGDNSVTIKCDYICNNTWRPMRVDPAEFPTYAVDSSVIGLLKVFVVNPLVAITGVDNKVRVNSYIRAGDDFQVSVPVFPTVFPSTLGTHYIPVKSSISPKTGYFPVYAGSWYRWFGSAYYVLRYAATSDHVAQFTPVQKFGTVYYCSTPMKVKVHRNGKDVKEDARYFVKADTGDSYMYLAPFLSFDSAYKFATTREAQFLLPYRGEMTEDRTWDGNTIITPVSSPERVSCIRELSSDDSFEILHEAGDDRQSSHMPLPHSSRNALTSMVSYNESFDDLKTLCRRYQIYTDISISLSPKLAFGEIFYAVPLYPNGPHISFAELGPGNVYYEFLNRARGSPMTILANGFRYFRGGLRAKILVRSSDTRDVIVSVTHMPDRLVNLQPGEVISVNTSGYGSHGYAQYAQSTRVNECIEIEIPYYLNSDYGVLTQVDQMHEDDQLRTSLGSLAFTLLSRIDDPMRLSIQVFLAFADDMRFSSFQGFSSIASTFQIPNHSPRSLSSAIQLSQPTQIEHQMWGIDEEIARGVRRAKAELEEAMAEQYPTVRETIRADVRQIVNDSVSDVWQQAQDVFAQIKDYIGDIANSAKNLMMNVVSNLVHVFLNPCLKSVVVALCCIIGLCVDGANWCLGSLVSFYNTFLTFVQNTWGVVRDFSRKCTSCLGLGCSRCGTIERNHVECPVAVHQGGPSDFSAIESLTVSYATLIASFFGYKDFNKTRSVPSFLSHTVLNYGKYASGVTGLVEFIKSNIRALYSCVDWLSVQITGSGLDYYICNYPADLQKFCQNAQAVLSPLNRERVFAEPYLQRSVFRLASIGQRILFMESRNATRDRVSLYVRDICTKLIALQDTLIAECLCPMVRYEPFVLQVVGAAGIGKSELAQTLGVELLKSINYTSYSEPMFTRTSGTQYWNGVRTQPIVYYDDFGFAKSGELAEAHVSELMQLKSCATFNPPIAELENKKVRYNPLIVYLSSNHAFFSDLTMMRDFNALHRRRDSLWQARLKPGVTMEEVKERYRQSRVKTYDHLEFGRYPDPKDESRLPERWLCYEDFSRVLKLQYQEYHDAQQTLYQQRLKDLGKLQPPLAGFEYDEALEQEVLDFLHNRVVAEDASLVEWRTRVQRDCDLTYRTVAGVTESTLTEVTSIVPQGGDDVTPLEEHFASCFDAEEIDEVRNSAVLPNWSSYYYSKLEKLHTPNRCQCDHWKYMTYRHNYMEFSNGEPAIYHLASIESPPEGMPTEIPAACTSAENCWLLSRFSEKFRISYANVNYDGYVQRGVSPSAMDVAPFSRWMFPSLQGGPDFEAAAQARNDSFFSRFKATRTYKVLGIIGQILKWFGVISMGLMAIFGGYKMLTKSSDIPAIPTTTPDPWAPDHQYMPSGDVRTGRKAVTKNWAKQAKARSHALKAKFAQPQYDATDPVSNIINLIKRNAFESFVKVDGVCRYSMKGLGLCGRIALTTKHFLEEFEFRLEEAKTTGASVLLTIKTPNNMFEFKFEQLRFTKVEDSSLALIEFPVSICCFRDIRHHIIKTDDVEYVGVEGRFYEFSNGDHNIIPIKLTPLEGIVIQGQGHISAQDLPMCYSYSYGGRGKCGSVVVAISPIPRIVGLHVAGVAGQNCGYAQAIFREMFEDLQAVKITTPNAEPQGTTIEPKIELPPGVIPIGVLKPEACPSYPRKSELGPSLAFDAIFPHKTEPAVLSKYDRRVVIDPDVEPLVKAIRSHGNVPLAFDRVTLSECVDDLSDFLIATTQPKMMFLEELLPDQIVFGGLPGYINKLNLSSSEGYPLSLLRQHNDSAVRLYASHRQQYGLPAKGKSWLFKYIVEEQGNQLLEIHPELVELMLHNDNLRKNNIVPATIFVDTLKDSRVSPEKVAAGKTRMFSISPVEYTWIIKKYFGVFQACYQESRISNGTAIGINVRGVEWTRLARTLLSKGNNFVDGDYKSFGDTLERQVMRGAFDAILNWYAHYFKSSVETQQYRNVLIEELFNAYHLVTNVIYQMVCGIPSGFALTVEINDLVNQLYIRYCWRKIMKSSLADYHKLCKTVTYGDDLIISVSDKAKDRFNFSSIQSCLESYNISFQPASKDGQCYHTRDLSDITFLKAHFVLHPTRKNQFLAQLPLESCLDTINWQYIKADPYKIIFENVRAALNNVYGHGEAVYSFWRKKIQAWFVEQARLGNIREEDAFVHLKTWKELDEEVFEDNC